MYYKNYSVGYDPNFDTVCILKYDKDMSNFKDSDFNRADHIVSVFEYPTFKFKNYKYHLDENELLLGVFPPEFIEACIEEYYVKTKQLEEERHKYFIESSKKSLDEDYIKGFKDIGASLENIIELINYTNKRNLKYNGIEFPIEEYYKDILIKYWGDFKL